MNHYLNIVVDPRNSDGPCVCDFTVTLRRTASFLEARVSACRTVLLILDCEILGLRVFLRLEKAQGASVSLPYFW